ncbi:MAG: DUF4263 domain-containing protein [Candidatus Colwellbacteria bacterium]|nr:DUF4263 domain-containing protein [Candidatus Colwellbacteria bacterium]
MEEKTPKEKIIEFFASLSWPGMTFEDGKISCPAGDIVVFDKNNIIIDFYFYNSSRGTYEKKNNRQTLVFSDGVSLDSVLIVRYGNGYDIPWIDYIRKILSIDDSFSEIKVSTTGKKIIRKVSEKTIQIPESVLVEMAEDSRQVYKSGNSSRRRLETYLINKLKLKYTGKTPKETTTVDKGDFSFLIERFNLKNKNKKKDYDNFLDLEDTKNLEYFTEKLIKDEVFSRDFLRSLDEFFIKERLRDIIKTGREILSLGKSDMSTRKAKHVIARVTDYPNDIKQLENLWQRYFEKYLLYLVFSYKKIYPKIEFKDIEGDKKYPDFIGINHYNGLDIIEIKTHLKNAVTWDSSHKNFSFSSELSKAVIQTMNYMDAIVQKRFEKNSDEKKITNMTEEENLYHPRGIIIISSDDKLTKSKLNKAKERCLKRDFTKLRNSLQNLEILTFSEILQIADDYVKNIHAQYE